MLIPCGRKYTAAIKNNILMHPIELIATVLVMPKIAVKMFKAFDMTLKSK